MTLHVIASGSAGNCYVLLGTGSALVIECGVRPEDVFRRVPELNPSRIAACLVSHEHGDHGAFAGRWADLGVPIVGSPGTLRALALERKPEARPVGRMTRTSLESGWKVYAFDVVHDAVEPYGFIIEHDECGRILFVTDTRYVPYSFLGLRLDHIMVEANYSDKILDERVEDGSLSIARAARVKTTHMSLQSACELVKANLTANLKTVVLLHLSGGNSDQDYFEQKTAETAPYAECHVAVQGLTVTMNKNEI